MHFQFDSKMKSGLARMDLLRSPYDAHLFGHKNQKFEQLAFHLNSNIWIDYVKKNKSIAARRKCPER